MHVQVETLVIGGSASACSLCADARGLSPLAGPAAGRGCHFDGLTVSRHNGTVSRRKTTVYLDADLLATVKILAATRESTESQLVEDALRAYLAGGHLDAAKADLRSLMARVAERADLDDDEAMALAVSEVRSVRSARRSAS